MLEYLTDAEVKIFCKPEELPLDENDVQDQEQIDATIPFPRYEIEPALRAGGYNTPLTEQAQVDSLKYLSVPIFKYYITNNNGSRTEQIEKDYERAKEELEKIANGEVNLELPSILDPDETNNGGIRIIDLDIY